jgi:hypothetical protein
VAALLRQEGLLEHPAIRRYLTSIRNPLWFTQTDDRLTEFEPCLRRRAPLWVCHAGYSDPARMTLLSRWLRAPDPDLQSAVVHVLARLDTPDARTLLEQVGDSDSQLASFARWCGQACDADVVGAAWKEPVSALKPPEPDAEAEQARRREIDADWSMLWLACRRTEPNGRGELIATLREHADVWDLQLRSRLQSSDPRDRVLALHIVSTQHLARQFRKDIEPLLNDSVEGIRQLTRRLMQWSSREPVGEACPVASQPRGTPPDTATLEQMRHELRAALERLGSGETDARDADLVTRVRGLLREVYDELSAPLPSVGLRERE